MERFLCEFIITDPHHQRAILENKLHLPLTMLNARRPWTGPFVFILRGSVFIMGIINSFQLSQVLFLPGHSAPRQMASIIQGPFLNQ